MQESFPRFNYLNESLIILPGNRFTKKELEGRLNQMGIDYNPYSNKNDLILLYDSNIRYDNNKILIYEKLRRDTQTMNIKNDSTQQRHSLPPNIPYPNSAGASNIVQGKAINISTESIEPFNIKKYNNVNQHIHNPLISNSLRNSTSRNIYEEEINTDIRRTSIPNQYNQNNNSNHRISNATEYDQESNFSFFSSLQGIPLFKNRQQLCYSLLYIIFLAFIGISLLFLAINNSATIADVFRDFFKLLKTPEKLIKVIWIYIVGLFFNGLNYWYIVIPLIIVFILGYYYIKKLLFENKCKEILKKIINDLEKMGRERGRYISENDIYVNYFKGEGINKDEFYEKYLPQLKKLIRDVGGLKFINNINKNGTTTTYLELDN